jgi:hypothetical protein
MVAEAHLELRQRQQLKIGLPPEEMLPGQPRHRGPIRKHPAVMTVLRLDDHLELPPAAILEVSRDEDLRQLLKVVPLGVAVAVIQIAAVIHD